MKRILVIGGAGFIGTHLVNRLITEGRRVRILDRIPIELRPSWINCPQIEYLIGDFVDHSAITVALKDVDVAYHLVSTTIPATSNVDPIFDVQSNLVGTLTFLKAAVESGIGKVIFASSGGTVYGKARSLPIREVDPTDPICSYGITKLAIEKYLALFEQMYGLKYIVFRLANAFGQGQRPGPQGAIAAFMQKVAKGLPIEIWGDGTVVRDYIYICDVVDALVRGATYDGTARIFNVGSGIGRTLNQIIEALRQLSGATVNCVHTAARSMDVPRCILDISSIKRELDWNPGGDFSRELAETWSWFKDNSDAGER